MPRIPVVPAMLCGLAAATLATFSSARGADPDAEKKSPLEFTVKDIDGKEASLSKYRGDVVLIVNTASKCGFTPQYASLEALYQKYKGKGLRILAFPSNDFGQQEPGKESDIKEFCTARYKTTFDLFSKVATKGPEQAPLYAWLTSKQTNGDFSGPIEWNFTKFLIGRDGKVITRFKSAQDPLSPEFTAAVETALKVSAPKTR